MLILKIWEIIKHAKNHFSGTQQLISEVYFLSLNKASLRLASA